MLDKKQLRCDIKNKRLALSESTFQAMSLSCFNNLIDLLSTKTFQKVGIYIDVRNEVSTRRIIEYLWQNNKEVYVPKCYEEGKMDFYKIDSWDDVSKGKYGILEPNTNIKNNHLDIMITPLVSFNKEGYRLGAGGGYYDRFYEKYPMLFIGLAFSFQEKEFVEENHDLQFDYIVLENQILKYK